MNRLLRSARLTAKPSSLMAPTTIRIHMTSQRSMSGFFDTIKDEALNVKEVFEVSSGKRSKKRTFLENPNKTPFVPPELLEMEKGHGAEHPHLNQEAAPEENADEAVKEDEESTKSEGPSEVVLSDKRTVWGRRIDNIKDLIRDRLTRTTNRVTTSESPTVQRILDAKYDMQDKLDDMRDEYNVSNDRVIAGIRRIDDVVSSESDQAFALGELMRVDPNFNQLHLVEDLEDYMIPVVVSSFFKGDIDMMRSVMGDMALDATTAAIRERVAKKQFWDPTVLGTSHVDIQEFTVENFIPMVRISFICDQIHCVRNAKDEVVEGGPTDLRRMFYMWTIRRDTVNPDFDWKIIDFKYQPMLALQ